MTSPDRQRGHWAAWTAGGFVLASIIFLNIDFAMMPTGFSWHSAGFPLYWSQDFHFVPGQILVDVAFAVVVPAGTVYSVLRLPCPKLTLKGILCSISTVGCLFWLVANNQSFGPRPWPSVFFVFSFVTATAAIFATWYAVFDIVGRLLRGKSDSQ
jgi:hypothetical protein